MSLKQIAEPCYDDIPLKPKAYTYVDILYSFYLFILPFIQVEA